MRATKEKAAGYVSPAASNDACNVKRSALLYSPQSEGRKTTGKFLGDILRTARRAAEVNFVHGPCHDDVISSLGEVRAATERAKWLCEYVRSEGQQ